MMKANAVACGESLTASESGISVGILHAFAAAFLALMPTTSCLA
jgi:hypothetical protein